jgi:hypothetical protein
MREPTCNIDRVTHALYPADGLDALGERKNAASSAGE